ncbi:MAG: YraN family protein [Clostridia bacterium]|nr:YraN family protein [Clostridia bacterium]
MAQKNFYKKFLGRIGEKKAVEYLKKQGYKILEKNFKTHVGEIDIIGLEKDVVCFIEVKTRSGDEYGQPSEAVNRKKQEKYFKVAEGYLLSKGLTEKECRFDVVEIEREKINLIKDAFWR